MSPLVESRRRFLTSSASGLGQLALLSMLQDDVSAAPSVPSPGGPGQVRWSHFAPRAKACIFIFPEGAPSQMDLWDPKPKLNELHGQPLPESMTKSVRFAFIQKETAVLMGSPRKFAQYGDSGMVFSDYLPYLSQCADDICMVRSMHTEAFNHHPGQLMMNTGSMQFGRPSIGSWLNYGLGSFSQNLPGYVVLNSGRGTSGGTSNWTSGFLPSAYQGVLFRNQGEPVLHLNRPPGISESLERDGLAAIRRMNELRQREVADPEIDSRIASYELAFRMQMSAPELIDFGSESEATLKMYGVDRPDPPKTNFRGGGPGVMKSFASNCLLARRLVERGVRYVNLYHASWDHHSNLDAELQHNCQIADQPVAALIKDLKQRGLLDSTLVVWAAEFGRTPLAENRAGRELNTGRDHHPFAYTIWMAGGGLKEGLTYGETDDIGWSITRDPVHVNDFHATLLHLFGVDHERLTYRFQGRDFRLTDVAGKVVTPWLA
jgi:hypothetical protein